MRIKYLNILKFLSKIRHVVKYAYEDEKHKVIVFEKKILRKLKGPPKVPNGLQAFTKNKKYHPMNNKHTKIHIDLGQKLPSHLNRITEIMVMKSAGHVARMEEGRSAFKILIGKPTGKRPLERLRRR